jgi:4-oxalocrotonate tautomerase
MPLAQITLWEGRSEEKREELIQKVTDAIQETLDCPRQAVTVVLQEVPKVNWGQGGVPTSKRT